MSLALAAIALVSLRLISFVFFLTSPLGYTPYGRSVFATYKQVKSKRSRLRKTGALLLIRRSLENYAEQRVHSVGMQ
jgi:hypothetical protein